MKRILMSLGAIVFVAAAAAGATGAFFSDAETSTGNTFTAGAIDLKVDAQAHYAGLICVDGFWAEDQTPGNTRPDLVGDPCIGTWTLTDLGPTNQFFNLSDIKPGDQGENTISLHVDNNDAYACADVSITSNDDLSTAEPELGAGDVAEDVGNNLDGELAQNLWFFAWADTDGDNIWDAGEVPLFSNGAGPASDALGGKHYTLASPQTAPLPPGSTVYIGLSWCAGTITVNGPGSLTCNGATMGNIAQTDGMTADITFRVEQARNNPNFSCTPAL